MELRSPASRGPESGARGWARADMHLHTSFSGWRSLRMIDAQDCYVDPDAAFLAARRRGMDFVCFTDHNTIDGAIDFLSRRPEEEPRVIVGEEVETRLPGSKQWIHLNVFGVDERTHEDLARLRADAFAAIAYLNERRLLFTLNHPFQSFRSIRSARRDLSALLPLVPAVEIANSSSPRSHRIVLERMLRDAGPAWPRAFVGGSDAHTIRRVAATHTAAPGCTKAEFLESVRDGVCAIGGEAPGLASLIRDIYQIIGEYYARTYGLIPSDATRPTAGNLLGSVVLLPAVILGLPAILTSLHALRQEWIARVGGWEKEVMMAPAPLPAESRLQEQAD